MPKFANTTASPDMQQHAATGGGFGFSAAKLSSLGADTYTLVSLLVDRSGSTTGFSDEIEKAVKAVVGALAKSPRADNLLFRVVRFNHDVEEIHGFKLLPDINLNDYDGKFAASGGTALYDATADSAVAIKEYSKVLAAPGNDYTVNGIFIGITDGFDEHSKLGIGGVREAIDGIMRGESLESNVSILIGVNVNDPRLAGKLSAFKDGAGFTQYVEAKDAKPGTIAKIANFVSKSVSAQSQAVGTGGPSQAITF